jgi:chromosome segregation ATPase
MESLSSAPGDPDSVIDYVWELGGDIEQALIKNEQLQRMIDAMQSESDKEMQLRKEQRIRESEAETVKLRRELDEMRDAREKQMSLFKALNERCESFKAQLQHRSPAVSAPAVDVTDSPLFQQLLQDKEKLQAEFDAFKEARFSTSRDEIEKLRQLLHSAQHAAALAQGKLEGVQMERDTYKNDLASRTDELPRMREKCAKADSITAQAEANAQMHAKAAIQAEERVKALEFQLHQAAMRADHERARCDSLDKDKEALRGEVQRMQELVSKCHASFDFESKHRLSELSRMRDEAQEREVALRKARDELSTARLAAEEHQHSQTRAIDLLQQQLDDAERRAKSASDSTQAMKARIASLEASLSESSVRRSPASNQHPILPSTIGAAGELDPSLVTEITSLQEQLFAVQSERDTYFRMSGEFERELVASGAALKELQGKIDAANSQIQEHAQRLADQVKKSSADAAEAAANMLRLQTQLQADVDAAKGRAAIAEASALSAKEETEVQIARANNLLQAEAAARAIAASERARLEAMTQDHAAGISRAQLLQKSLSDSEEALYRTKSELDREKEVASSSLAAATSTAKELMDKVRVLETRLSDAQQQNSLLENQLQRLERSLSDHGAPETEAPESDREQRELRAYVERERDRLKHQLEASEATCRRLKFQLDAKEREAAELQAEVEISRQRLSGPCYTQVDLDRLGNLQKQVSLLTESNEHLRSQESTAHKLALQWEERYNGVQSEMMQLRQAATLHAQVPSAALCHYKNFVLCKGFFEQYFYVFQTFLCLYFSFLLLSPGIDMSPPHPAPCQCRGPKRRICQKLQRTTRAVFKNKQQKSGHRPSCS